MTSATRAMMTPWSLGASMYVPATHPELLTVMQGARTPHVRSLIVCTEDAIRDTEVQAAVATIVAILAVLPPDGPRCFVRLRNGAVLRALLDSPHVGRLDGFVLPKATAAAVRSTLELLGAHRPHVLMPILETREVFDAGAMREFAAALAAPAVRDRILMVRIGGNDLLSCLGLRRDISAPIYASPIGAVIAQLATIFLPEGLSLSAPVFEGLAHAEVLRQEVKLDLAHGLSGKTAVHPIQVDIIERAYRVPPADLEMAGAILNPRSPAVFRLHDTMCERAVHARWAHRILERAALFGVVT